MSHSACHGESFIPILIIPYKIVEFNGFYTKSSKKREVELRLFNEKFNRVTVFSLQKHSGRNEVLNTRILCSLRKIPILILFSLEVY